MIKDKRAFVAQFQSVIALALMVIFLTWRYPAFLSGENIQNILQQISVNLCLSIGMTLVILTGGIDLSVGSVLAVAGAVAALALKNGVVMPAWDVRLEFTVAGAIAVAVIVGAVLGMVNGAVITRLKVPAFIATLGMMSAGRGLTGRWTEHHPITGLGKAFEKISFGKFAGVPVQVWIAGVLAGVFIVVMRRTRFGRYVYAVGGNERAALLSGLPVRRVKMLVYTIGGALAGVAALIQTSRLDSADPNAGFGYELDSIAAVVIGGTSLSGGRGSILGTILGCLMIGVLSYGLNVLGVSSDWQLVLKGGVIVAAAAMDRRGMGDR